MILFSFQFFGVVSWQDSRLTLREVYFRKNYILADGFYVIMHNRARASRITTFFNPPPVPQPVAPQLSNAGGSNAWRLIRILAGAKKRKSAGLLTLPKFWK